MYDAINAINSAQKERNEQRSQQYLRSNSCSYANARYFTLYDGELEVGIRMPECEDWQVRLVHSGDSAFKCKVEDSSYSFMSNSSNQSSRWRETDSSADTFGELKCVTWEVKPKLLVEESSHKIYTSRSKGKRLITIENLTNFELNCSSYNPLVFTRDTTLNTDVQPNSSQSIHHPDGHSRPECTSPDYDVYLKEKEAADMAKIMERGKFELRRQYLSGVWFSASRAYSIQFDNGIYIAKSAGQLVDQGAYQLSEKVDSAILIGKKRTTVKIDYMKQGFLSALAIITNGEAELFIKPQVFTRQDLAPLYNRLFRGPINEEGGIKTTNYFRFSANGAFNWQYFNVWSKTKEYNNSNDNRGAFKLSKEGNLTISSGHNEDESKWEALVINLSSTNSQVELIFAYIDENGIDLKSMYKTEFFDGKDKPTLPPCKSTMCTYYDE